MSINKQKMYNKPPTTEPPTHDQTTKLYRQLTSRIYAVQNKEIKPHQNL